MEYTFDIDEIIAKRLTGEINPEENKWLEEWLNLSNANRLYLQQMEGVWSQSAAAQTTLTKPLDVEAALHQTKLKIKQTSARKSSGFLNIPIKYWAVAATVSLLAAALWFFQNTYPENVQLTTNDQTLQDTLSDGSMVALNHHSSLSTTFDQKSRKVKLRGEAYFNVTPAPAKPFEITVKRVLVTVVGTRFNVDNRSDSTKVVVSVEEGKVKVQSGSKVIYLTAGEQATIDCFTNEITLSQVPKSGNVKGWLDRRFVFDDVPLSEVIPIINDAYGVRIELKNPALGECRLHTRFNDEPIQRIIELIADTFSLKIEARNGRIILDGTGCGN
ncbi:MAG: FecR domain-containing protein [Saprospiraceae bacterium]|nr:FecR domain-containing protein [Saprospiraceae bacterium]